MLWRRLWFFRCGRPHFLVHILRIFRNLWYVRSRTDKGGGRVIEAMLTFCGQEKGGLFFAILCGRPSWTAPYSNTQQQRDKVCVKFETNNAIWVAVKTALKLLSEKTTLYYDNQI